MTEDCVELLVDFPGKEYARVDYDPATGQRKLQEVVYPETYLPADLCSLPNTCTEDTTELPALLIRNIALPPGCRVPARPIGLCRMTNGKASQSILLFVPSGDLAFANVACLGDLPEKEQIQITDFLKSNEAVPWELIIQDAETAWNIIHAARKNYRIQQTKQQKNRPSAPAWQPHSSPVAHRLSGEAEHYTESEYSYWRLPRRFQKYIEEYLQPNERVLASLHRPVMRSALMREFLTGKRMQESVLIVTDRQITLIEEKIPPSQSDVNYGFIATCCVPERLARVETAAFNPEVMGLRLGLQASGGIHSRTFEFPAFCSDEVDDIANLLMGWLPIPEDLRLRRATLENIPEKLPRLSDPACNHPKEMDSVSHRFQSMFSTVLRAHETILDWCLLPAWLSGASVARVLAITPFRLVVLSESDADYPEMDISHHQVASMEFCSTYMDAHLSLFLPKDRRVREESIRFSKTLAAMERCFHVLQQAVAMAPSANATSC